MRSATGRRLGGALLLAWPLAACGGEREAGSAGRTTAAVHFVDEASCAACHPKEAAAWKGSHHERAMLAADPSSVRGDFDGARFTLAGEELVFRREGGRYLLEAQAADGSSGRALHEVPYTFGWEPLQQVLVDVGDGKLQALRVGWDVAGERWFDALDGERGLPGEGLHWRGAFLRWNSMCAECHTTGFEKRYDAEHDRYDSRFALGTVGCQACHGPGEAHLAWAAARPRERGARTGLVSLASASAELESCAPCHSRRERVAPSWSPGTPYLEAFAPVLLREGLYHPDGQIQDEVFELGSFLQSKMHAAGVRCTDCHDPHALGTRASGNALCTTCHSPSPPLARFPSLRGASYDDPAHHRHAPGSPGAQCVACHMPETTYMVVDPRRDHSFRIPRPDLAQELGVPDACSACHSDRAAGFAAQAARAFWGEPDPRDQAHARVFAAARAGRVESLPELVALARDATRPAIVRASALELCAPWAESAPEALAAALADPEPLVRRAALEALAGLPPQRRPALASRALEDPSRAVRTSAARVLAPARDALLPEARAPFARAFAELEEALSADLDLPQAAVELAMLRERTGDLPRAEEGYRRALAQDQGFHPARHNLAALLDQLGRPSEAAEVLGAGRALDPDDGELAFGHGLALAAAGELEQALLALERAAELLPREARVWRNLGLARARSGQPAAAEAALRRAFALSRGAPEAAFALASFLLEQGRPEEVPPLLEPMAARFPGDERIRALLTRARASLEAAEEARRAR